MMLVGEIEGPATFQSFACCERVNPLPAETGKPQGWERSGSNPGCKRHLLLTKPIWKTTRGGLWILLVLGEDVPTEDS